MQASKIVRWQNFAISLMLACLCIIAGSYSLHYQTHWDMTAQSRHSLNPKSQAIMQLMDKPISILAILGPNRHQRNAVDELINKYQQVKPDITLEYLNPETNPARVESLKANAQGEIIIYYNQSEQRLRVLNEHSLSRAFQLLARPSERKVLFTTGHQERDPNGQGNRDYQEVLSRLSDTGYQFDTISLVTQPAVPSNTDLLVIANPKDTFFPGEVASILNYLSSGGNLLYLQEPGVSETGLEALEIELGVSPLPGKIIEANSKLFNIDSPTFIVIDKYPNSPILNDFNSITLFPEAQGLSVLPLQERAIIPLLQSSDNSWTETGLVEGQVKFDENSEEVQGPITLAVSIERQRTSAKQRIIVIGDADFMANTWLGNGGNRAFTERLFNWLTTDDKMLELPSSLAQDQQINISSQSLLTLAIIYLFVLPIIFFSLAVRAWRSRKLG